MGTQDESSLSYIATNPDAASQAESTATRAPISVGQVVRWAMVLVRNDGVVYGVRHDRVIPIVDVGRRGKPAVLSSGDVPQEKFAGRKDSSANGIKRTVDVGPREPRVNADNAPRDAARGRPGAREEPLQEAAER